MKSRVAGLLALSVLPLAVVGPLLAQEQELPRSLRFSLGQTLSYGDTSGTTDESILLSTTSLGFKTSLKTAITDLSFDTGTALRIAGDGSGGAESEFDQPRLQLRYARRAADADIAVAASFRRDDITYLRLLDIFVDEEGNLLLPDDIFQLQGSGERRDYSASVQVNARKQAPLTLSFGLDLSGRDYVGVDTDALFDSRTIGANLGVGLRFSPVMQGNLAASASLYEAEDIEETERLRQSLSFGLTRKLREDLSLGASIGVSSTETETIAGTERIEGLTGSLDLGIDRPNGAISASIAADTTLSGTRVNAQIGRSLSLANGGSLNATIGVTRPEDTGEIDTVATLGLNRPLGTGQLGLTYSRSATLIGVDQEERLVNQLSASYARPLTETLSIGLNGAYVDSDGDSRSSLSTSVNYALTEKLAVNTGYRFDSRASDGADNDDSSIFISLGRAFDLPF
ncbi:porin family protein [Limimaricola litoreus]|uniref:Porin n=1 Tax=Limimaricola litoreus TaxID=2955316 RepID=A0A9X2FTX1_9RHOB|nr:hypothetical protein [Limimaricola litoreus]MCP1168381.1 hypothetical protein [Limimaricola litoreus]